MKKQPRPGDVVCRGGCGLSANEADRLGMAAGLLFLLDRGVCQACGIAEWLEAERRGRVAA